MTDKHPLLAPYRTAFRASRHASRSARAACRLGALAVAVFALTPLAVPAASPAAAASRQTATPGHSRTLISATVIERISKRAVAAELASARLGRRAPALGAGKVRYGLVAYRVLYRTVNAKGQPVHASGLVAFPAGGPRRLRLVDYGHGTSNFKLDVSSTFGLDPAMDGIEGRWSAELFASAGFAVAEPDYVGMGASPGRPEYEVAASEVSASADLLRATRQIANSRGSRIDPGVLVTGFSQGGAAAMAVGRALQHGAVPGLHPRALAPMSGPYDLIGAEVPGMFNGQVNAGSAVYLTGYALTAWNPLYHLYAQPTDAFRQPYASRIAALFNGYHTFPQISQGLPPTMRDLYTPAYLRLLRHPAGALRRALIVNSTCAGWTPGCRSGCTPPAATKP
jgi:dienelactone hydrolase